MSDLFENPRTTPDWSPDAKRSHPALELVELVLLGSWSPPEATILRRIEFRRGLNIVWADPKIEQGKASGDTTSGHSAGKTTLCRILRWLLGETHFGNPDLEARIATKFIKGWAILSLRLDGKPWVIGRSFFSKQDHQAVQSSDLNAVIQDGFGNGSSPKEFFAALEQITLRPLAKRRFPGRDEDIDWTQLLAWLARDQEAALQSVEAWRSSVGGPQDRGPTKFERHVLLRLAADLLSPEEWKEMDDEARLEATKKKLQAELPSLEAIANESCEPLRRIFTGAGDGTLLAGDLVISKASHAVAEKERQLNALAQSIAAHDARESQQKHEQALRALVRAEGAVTLKNRRFKQLQQQMSELAGAIIKAKAVLEQRRPPPGYCGRKKEEVEGKCEFYQDGIENLGATALTKELEEKQQAIESQLREESEELTKLTAELPLLETNEANLRSVSEAATAAREELVKAAERLREQIASDNAVLEPALEKRTAFNKHNSDITSLSDDIRQSRQRQTTIRQSHWNNRLDLAEHYRAVLSFLLGPKVGGNILFDKDGQLVVEAENRSALSSAAIEALKALSFDLACMFRSVAGSGQHPRFLIHDSPKVADMSPLPYAALFELLRTVEQTANGNPTFQYIITTTEPPPKDFIESDYMILKLDASTKTGRLLKEDL